MKLRAATARDKAAIRAFCLALDPEDYIPQRLDWLMANGTVLLLEDGRRLLGIDRFERKPDGSVWFSAARIHPDIRGQGWINRMNEHARGLKALAGVRAGRMLIEAGNTSSLRAASKAGYEVVLRLAILEWERGKRRRADPHVPQAFVPCPPGDFRTAAQLSPILGMMGGRIYLPPEVVEMNGPALEWASRHGWLYRSPFWGPLVARAGPYAEPKRLYVQPFATTGQGVEAVLAFMGSQPAETGQVVVPDEDLVTGPYLRAGLADDGWGRHVVIAERRFVEERAPTSPSRRGAARKRRRR